ncbi:NYN domain-containing protein [Candidatus Saccharibacteria bacterium]|nr:NYN domain-containing protein [Candidatus Saccharibacteria bacterium]
MDKSKQPQIYAFIDSQNLNVSTQKFGWKMDWRKFREFLAAKYGVTKAYMFIGYVPEFQEMYEFLHDAGFAIVLKPTFDVTRPYTGTGSAGLDGVQGAGEQRTESYMQYGEGAAKPATPQSAKSDSGVGGSADEQAGAARKPVKGNVDADLVLWTMKEMKNYDKAVIVSGDGDFYSLIEYLEKENKLLKLLTPSIHYSGLLKPFEAYIEQLGQYRRELNYRSKKTSPRK